jgi:hypothetical protein
MNLQNAAAVLDVLETILNDIARSYGNVFNPDCRPALSKQIYLLLGRD